MQAASPLKRLSSASLGDARRSVLAPRYDRGALGIGIVHIGPGAFHRAHQAVFTEDAMEASGGNWGICAISLNSEALADDLTSQDGLYTLAINDRASSFRLIGAIKSVIAARRNPKAAMKALTDPLVTIVTLTITEKGYALNASGQLDTSNPQIAHDLKSPQAPQSAIGYIAEATRLRREAGTAPLTFISCDNLPANGDKLRANCISFAAKIDQSLAQHIAVNLSFPNTMVDSITPATDAAVIAQVKAAIGLIDVAPVQREAFAQWVIEDNLPLARPNWEAAGVIVTPDVKPFELAKLRVLNGAHSTLAYLGLLLGLSTVEEAIGHPELRHFVEDMICEETLPTLSAPAGLDLPDYWRAIVKRFENPQIRHKLEQISHDGSQKIPARILPVILAHSQNGEVAKRACFVLAAWIYFNQSRRAAGQPPIDGFLTQLEAALPAPTLLPQAYFTAFWGMPEIIPSTVSSSPELRDVVQHFYLSIATHGIAQSIADQDALFTSTPLSGALHSKTLQD